MKLLIVNSEEMKSFGGEVKYNKIESFGQYSNDIQNFKYEDKITFPIEMVAEDVLSDEMVREIYQNYFNLADYANLYIRNTDWEYLHFECTINEIEKIMGGVDGEYGIVGFKGIVTCNSAFIYEETDGSGFYTDTYTSFPITLINDSDCRDYLYPIVTIVTGSAGNITITNTSDGNRQTIITGAEAGQTITINQKTGLVTATPSTDSYYQKFNKIYPRLLSGINNITAVSTGTIVSISFTYKKARVIF